MSNNKQSMKLYTENDLIDLVQSLKDYTRESHTILGDDEREAKEFVDIFLKDRTPMELPSDEEIEDAALSFCNSQELSSDTSYYGFWGATQWILSKLQGGNK